MALQSFTLTIGAAKDSDNNDKNYVSGQTIYIKRTNGTLASIYRDLAGTSPITQDGLSNVTNSSGQFTFFVEAGDYNAEYQSQVTPITVVGADYFNSRIDETVNQIILDLSTSRGFRVQGTFAAGFTYELPNDVGLDASGNAWIYTDVNALPFTVPAATTPSSPTYTQVTFNQASNVGYSENGDVENALRKRAGYYTLAEAQVADLEVGQYVILTDRGEGLFIVRAVGMTANNRDVIAISDGKSLEYVYQGKLKIRHFGSASDGVADDAEIINAAILYAKNQTTDKVVWLDKQHSVQSEITLHVGVKLKSETMTTLYKDHALDGVVRDGSLIYDSSGLSNISVVGRGDGFEAGTGVKLINCVRNTHDNVNVSDCGFGFSMLNCISNKIPKLTLDRNGEGLYIASGSNFNYFGQVIIISDTDKVGVHFTGTHYSNTFDMIDVEYASYPIWFGDGARGININTYYAEFCQDGIRTDTNGDIDDITFGTVFNSSVQMFSDTLFTAKRKNITINNVTDEFPVGLGGVDVMAQTHGMGAQPVGLRQSENLGDSTRVASIVKSLIAVNCGSLFDVSCEVYQQYVGSFVLSSTTQWGATASAVTVNADGFFGAKDSYTIPPSTFITHVKSAGSAMANRGFTASLWVKGDRGDRFELRMTDNVTATQSRIFEIASDGWSLASAKFSWGAGSTGSNYGLTISTTQASNNMEFACPNVYDGLDTKSPIYRGSADNAYLQYKFARFFGFNANVEVYGDAAPVTAVGWVNGDRVLNNNPSGGAFSGWVLVAGIWKGFSLIES